MTVSDAANWLGLIQFAAGLVTAFITSAIWRRLPHRFVWRFSASDDVVVCLATSHMVDTGSYLRPTTGIGQVKALAHVIPSILTAYGDKRRVITYLSEEIPAEALSQNIVVVGGVKNNAVAQRFFDKLYDQTGLCFDTDRNTIMLDGERYKAQTQGGKLTKDWAVIVRAPNPFSEGRTWVTILAGSSTYGVAAAARYLVETRALRKLIRQRAYVRLCEVEVMHGEIASICHTITKVIA